MSIVSRAVARAAGLPAAESHAVVVERDLEVKMPDGAILLADRWFAPDTVASAPIVLVRSPYGRKQLGFLGRIFAAHRYQVVIQSCRGTFGSDGTFDPFHHERVDGLATLDWLASQPWFTGSVGMFGPSYLGIAQWAVAADPPDYLKALALSVTASSVRDAVVYPSGSFSLETGASWVDFVEGQELALRQRFRRMVSATKRISPAFRCLPLRDADVRTVGHRVPYYQDWLAHELPGDGWWDPVDFSQRLDRVPAASLVGGWYDIFLAEQVRDYTRLRDEGRPVRLTIGPWTHQSPRGAAWAVRDAFDWFSVHLRGDPPEPWAGLARLYVMGSDRWVDVPDWPPAARVQRWQLQPGGRLEAGAAPPTPPDSYRYDPSDPTPGVGGATLNPANAGSRDQLTREARPDVLCYTTAPLGHDLTVAGPLAAEIWVRSSRPNIDVFVRLCDVDPVGRSTNVSDGILRIDPRSIGPGQDGSRRIRVDMWPTAITFRQDHRLRLQVSSGAHPLFARNPGTGERLATAATLVASEIEVFHDPDHPSGIDLPISPI